mmetsp:Transcript_46178/g.67759  ORF Transcript_46178/g.67759 Transcript_46178/m.67759 type:complete len:484 (+) Transcript_46178:60-1511(+)
MQLTHKVDQAGLVRQLIAAQLNTLEDDERIALFGGQLFQSFENFSDVLNLYILLERTRDALLHLIDCKLGLCRLFLFRFCRMCLLLSGGTPHSLLLRSSCWPAATGTSGSAHVPITHAAWSTRVTPLTTTTWTHVALAIGLTHIAAAHAVVHGPATSHLLHVRSTAARAAITRISSSSYHAPAHIIATPPPRIHHVPISRRRNGSCHQPLFCCLDADLLNGLRSSCLASWYPSSVLAKIQCVQDHEFETLDAYLIGSRLHLLEVVVHIQFSLFSVELFADCSHELAQALNCVFVLACKQALDAIMHDLFVQDLLPKQFSNKLDIAEHTNAHAARLGGLRRRVHAGNFRVHRLVITIRTLELFLALVEQAPCKCHFFDFSLAQIRIILLKFFHPVFNSIAKKCVHLAEVPFLQRLVEDDAHQPSQFICLLDFQHSNTIAQFCKVGHGELVENTTCFLHDLVVGCLCPVLARVKGIVSMLEWLVV